MKLVCANCGEEESFMKRVSVEADVDIAVWLDKENNIAFDPTDKYINWDSEVEIDFACYECYHHEISLDKLIEIVPETAEDRAKLDPNQGKLI